MDIIQGGNKKADKPKVSKPKDVKAKDAKPKAVKAKDAKPKDVKAKDAKPKAVKAKDVKPKATKVKDTKANEDMEEYLDVVAINGEIYVMQGGRFFKMPRPLRNAWHKTRDKASDMKIKARVWNEHRQQLNQQRMKDRQERKELYKQQKANRFKMKEDGYDKSQIRDQRRMDELERRKKYHDQKSERKDIKLKYMKEKKERFEEYKRQKHAKYMKEETPENNQEANSEMMRDNQLTNSLMSSRASVQRILPMSTRASVQTASNTLNNIPLLSPSQRLEMIR